VAEFVELLVGRRRVELGVPLEELAEQRSLVFGRSMSGARPNTSTRRESSSSFMTVRTRDLY